MERWRKVAVVLSSIGIIDGTYLTADSLFPSIPIICPSVGIINCGTVTTSSYSRLLGVPVALLGTLFFVTMLGLVLLNRPSTNILMVPLWFSGVAFAGYLIFVELFVLRAICPYCTLAHSLAVLIGIPAFKLALGPE